MLAEVDKIQKLITKAGELMTKKVGDVQQRVDTVARAVANLLLPLYLRVP